MVFRLLLVLLNFSFFLSLVSPIIFLVMAQCGCESWALRKNEERHLDAFEMNGLRKILRVSRTVSETNDCDVNQAKVRKEL